RRDLIDVSEQICRSTAAGKKQLEKHSLQLILACRIMWISTTGSLMLCFAFQVQVWDTAGQERFRKSMVEHYYRNVHAVVFVYDVTKMTSFTNLKMWIEECNGHAVPPLVPKVLVGNKCDLKELIQVPSSMALKFADAHNMLLFETSAKDPKESQNVESIFMCLACRLKAQKSLLYRDVERQQGRVQKLEFTQDANGKNSCPC
uniref:RAB33A, member RAS onco family n=1 Tax=Dromaius novaehollandiae TaxID=8790 RepID=A0A8C4K9W6_DRONO